RHPARGRPADNPAQPRRNGGTTMTTTLPEQVPSERPVNAAPLGTLLAPEPPTPAAIAAPGVDKRVKALQRFAVSITVCPMVGPLFLGFEQAPITPIACVLTGYVVDLILETLNARAEGRPAGYAGGWRQLVTYLLPAHIAGLACGMLLYGNE